MFSEIINTSNLPTLDLHGEICDIARVLINDFISDNIKEKNKVIVIIHGKGSGKIKRITHEVLRENRSVLEYKTSYFNDGMTLVKLNI